MAIVPRRWHIYGVELAPRIRRVSASQRERAGSLGTATFSSIRSSPGDNELFGSDLGAIPEALQGDVRRALLEFVDLD